MKLVTILERVGEMVNWFVLDASSRFRLAAPDETRIAHTFWFAVRRASIDQALRVGTEHDLDAVFDCSRDDRFDRDSWSRSRVATVNSLLKKSVVA